MQRVDLIVLLSLLLVANWLPAQEPQVKWDLDFDEDGNQEFAYSLALHPENGNFLVGGMTYQDSYEVLVAILQENEDGDDVDVLEWEYYGYDGAEYYPQLIPTTDGGYAFTCRSYTEDENYDFLLMKLDEDLEEEWDHFYGNDNNDGMSMSIAPPLLQMEDGGYVLGGVWIEDYGDETSTDAVVIFTDENGENEIVRGFGSADYLDGFYEFIETEDGILCIGFSPTWTGDLDIWLQMMDPEDGDSLWAVFVELDEYQLVYDAMQTSDGGFVIAGENTPDHTGSSNSDALLIKTDSEGNLEWWDLYGGEGFDRFTSVVELYNGAIAAVGASSSYSDDFRNPFIVIVSDEGDSLWAEVPARNRYSEFRSVVETESHDIVIAGYASTANQSYNVWLRSLTSPQFGVIEGYVYNLADSTGFINAAVTMNNGRTAQTDSSGFYKMKWVWSDSISLTASTEGYADLTIDSLYVAQDETLTVNFGMSLPEMVLSENEIHIEEMELGDWQEVYFTMRNIGDGPMVWQSEFQLWDTAGYQPWERREFDTLSTQLNEYGVQGVAYLKEQFIVTGNDNDTNKVYVLDRHGDLVRSFNQWADSRRGMYDLTVRDTLIWGVQDDLAIGFTSEGDSVTTFHTETDRNRAIAWDPERELFWISEAISDIYGYDADGNHEDENILSRNDWQIQGLAYNPRDDYSLFVLTKPEYYRQIVYKINPETNESVFVKELMPQLGGSPGGAFITDQLDPFKSLVFMNISNTHPDSGGDRIDIWHLKSNTWWMNLEPASGVLDASEELDLTLFLNSRELSYDTIPYYFRYEGLLTFEYNAIDGFDTISISMDVTGLEEVDFKHNASSFILETPYPNPFNSITTISYGLPVASQVSMRLYDLSGRMVTELVNDHRSAGWHSAVWDASAVPSGMYFVRLEAGGKMFTQKIMLIR